MLIILLCILVHVCIVYIVVNKYKKMCSNKPHFSFFFIDFESLVKIVLTYRLTKDFLANALMDDQQSKCARFFFSRL